MEEETMELRDLPVDTRNYTIVDNITGKPIEQSNYSLTIDPEVINKLNTLKKLNEEKIKQATLRGIYQDSTLVDTFTPEDNSVFTPVHDGEYISNFDFNVLQENTKEDTSTIESLEQTVETPSVATAEVFEQDDILTRVIARDPVPVSNEEPEETSSTSEDGHSEEMQSEETFEQNHTPIQDNSTFTPEMAGLQQASEQIVKIDTKKLGPAIKPPKGKRPSNKINLDKMEIKEGKGIAWLAYLLFFIPLFFKRNNRFVRHHANEGLELNIMEILGVALILPYFLLTNLSQTLQLVVIILALCGVVIIGMCILTIPFMMLFSLCGLQFQNPWLWKKRIIKIKETRE